MLSARSKAHRIRTMFFFICFFFARSTPHSPVFSLDHFVRSCQHVRWNIKADLLRGFEVHDEFEIGPLFDGYVGWLGSLENLVHVNCETAKRIGYVASIAHQPATFTPFRVSVNCWNFAFQCKLDDLLWI